MSEPDKVQKLFQEAVLLGSQLFEQFGELSPALGLIVAPSGRFAQKLVWKDQVEKDFIMACFKADMMMVGATHYALIFESWLTYTQAGSDLKTPPDRRREVLAIHAEERGGKQMFGWREIHTVKRRGEIARSLGELEHFPTDTPGSELKGGMTKL